MLACDIMKQMGSQIKKPLNESMSVYQCVSSGFYCVFVIVTVTVFLTVFVDGQHVVTNVASVK